jgi:hypothetical protein
MNNNKYDAFYSKKPISELIEKLKNHSMLDEEWHEGLVQHISKRVLSNEEKKIVDHILSSESEKLRKERLERKRETKRDEIAKTQNVNYFGFISAIIMVIAVFMPWVAVNSSASVLGYSASFSSGGIGGINFGGGILGIFVAILGGFLIYNENKFSIIAGVFNFFIGISYVFGWFGVNGISGMSYSASYSGFGGSAKASIDPQYGLYLFVIGAIIFILASIKYLNKFQQTPPQLPNVQYNIIINNQQSPPYSLEQIRDMIHNGQIRKDTLVWKQGMNDWERAEEQMDLKKYFSSIPPPPPSFG